MARILNNVTFVLSDDGTVSIVIGREKNVNILDSELAATIVREALATEEVPGVVKPDGVTTFVDENGVLSAVGGGGGGGTPTEDIKVIQGTV